MHLANYHHGVFFHTDSITLGAGRDSIFYLLQATFVLFTHLLFFDSAYCAYGGGSGQKDRGWCGGRR